MLPAGRTAAEGFAIPTFDVVPRDVEGFMEVLWELQSVFHDCFARSEPRAHFYDYPYYDDYPSRIAGAQIGQKAWAKAQEFYGPRRVDK